MDLSRDFALEMEQLWLINKLTSRGNSKYVSTEFARLEDAAAILSYLDLFMAGNSYRLELAFSINNGVKYVSSLQINYKNGQYDDYFYINLLHIRHDIRELKRRHKEIGRVSLLHRFFHFIYNPCNQ